MDSIDIRALVPDLGGTVYLNTATMAAGCMPVKEAYERALEAWMAGRFDWTEAEQAGEECRSAFARMVGASPDEIAIVPAVSTAAGLVAASLPTAVPGGNVVVGEAEFSSNYFPWLMLRERGYDVRTIPYEDGRPRIEHFEAAADGGTRLIAVSGVQSSSGFRADLAEFSRVAASSGAWLFVDGCQAAGAVPLDVARDRVDFLASASHKFLLGARGMGYLFVRRGLLDRIRPASPGWKAAREPLSSFYGPAMTLSETASRLDTSLPWFGALADRAAFGIFERFGVQQVLDRNAGLSRRLHDRLVEARPEFRPPPEANRSMIVSIPVRDADNAMSSLRTAGIVASVRAGRVRLSPHFYNLEEQIDRAVEILAKA
jgi:selenocysteine lyase/cysteine desulfurase